MNRLPQIGEHVRYGGKGSIGACTGTVVEIYPSHDLQQPRRWVETPFRPERWRVAVKVDEPPSPWPFGSYDSFAPKISEIEPVSSNSNGDAERA